VKVANGQISSQQECAIPLRVGVIIMYLVTLDMTLGPLRLSRGIRLLMVGALLAYFVRRFPTTYRTGGGTVRSAWAKDEPLW